MSPSPQKKRKVGFIDTTDTESVVSVVSTPTYRDIPFSPDSGYSLCGTTTTQTKSPAAPYFDLPDVDQKDNEDFSDLVKKLEDQLGFEEDDREISPHYNTCWVDENGSDVTSYIFLLPSACTPDQIDLTVHDKKPEFTVKYTYPLEMSNLNIIMAPGNLNVHHSKVAAFTKMFEGLCETLDGKQKTVEFTIKLPFVVESEP